MSAIDVVDGSLTDPDARSMATSGRGSGVVGYNVQVAIGRLRRSPGRLAPTLADEVSSIPRLGATPKRRTFIRYVPPKPPAL
jgi:hypothetical protein